MQGGPLGCGLKCKWGELSARRSATAGPSANDNVNHSPLPLSDDNQG